MIISYAWLKELIDLPVSPEELSDVLTFLGLEVESTTTYKPSLTNVVIGEIVECNRLEGSDHLWVTRTNVGGETLTIVCGAPNARAGLKVVVMLPGSVTADGMTIKKAKLRGQESFGMIASERELGLVEEHAGIIEGDADWKVGAPAENYINLPDTVYDVEITPNRPDYLSHVGVARDLGAKFKLPWKWPEFVLTESGDDASTQIAVEILCPDGCPRYAARVLKGVKVAPSPFAARLRLNRCGIRPISNIVDATNTMMLLYGQPLHAFDQRFIEGGKIIVRYAGDEEKFVTLDGKEHTLSGRDVVIADTAKGVAIGGVMGGLNSEIREDTTDVIIECANFDAVHIRRSARALGFGTDASRRFERGVDPNGVTRVIDATTALMNQWGGGQVLRGSVDNYAKKIQPVTAVFRPERAEKVIGLHIAHDGMKDILERLGCEVKAGIAPWTVAVPTFRPDLEREIDLIEEVIRVHGYEEIPTAEVSRVPLEGGDNPLVTLKRKVVDVMVGLGFNETMSLSMYTPDARRDPPDVPVGVVVKNPVTDDMLNMQGSLLPQMIRSAAANWQRGDRNLRLFEVARVFREGASDDPRTWERQILTAVMTGQSYPAGWAHQDNPFDFYDLKGIIEVLASKISLDNVQINCYDSKVKEVIGGEVVANGGSVGKWGIWSTEIMSKCDIDASVGWFEMDLGIVYSLRRSEFKYEPLPRFPLSWRDIAVVVEDSVTVGELLQTIREKGGAYLMRAEPFDVFRGEKLGTGKKSIAIRLEFSHPDRSLESAEIDDWMNKILAEMKTAHGANLR